MYCNLFCCFILDDFTIQTDFRNSANRQGHHIVKDPRVRPDNNDYSSTTTVTTSSPSSTAISNSVKPSEWSNNAYLAYKDKLKSANLSGLWEQDENVRYILFEDFKNGKVIGFMQHDGVTQSTITGNRRPGNTFKVMEKMHDTEKRFEYVITLFPREQRIEMKNFDGCFGMIPLIPINLKLHDKFIPPDLFQELDQLKRIENYDGYRFMF